MRRVRLLTLTEELVRESVYGGEDLCVHCDCPAKELVIGEVVAERREVGRQMARLGCAGVDVQTVRRNLGKKSTFRCSLQFWFIALSLNPSNWLFPLLLQVCNLIFSDCLLAN